MATPESKAPAPSGPRPQVIVVTTAMLVFISYWRAAAIVLCDMASTVYYIGGIVEQAIGKAAPWYIGAVMLFAYAVRGVYIESCAMFVRGGVYRVVKEAMGGTLAKLSVSALMFDYVLTGPISGVSAGQYIVGLANELLHVVHLPIAIPSAAGSAAIAVGITLYFWHQNILGIEESSDKAMKIMGVTTVMVVVMMLWCGATLWTRGATLPPFDLHFSNEALGWLGGTGWEKKIGALGILIAFGHSILAMSGEESLAQVNREIAYPKVPNLIRAGFIIFLFSMLTTGLISFFAVLIIPDDVRMSAYSDNLVGGLAMYVVGPLSVRLVLRAFVVVVGFLILAGAVNTAIVGSNGVLNRVAEDGVLADWFRLPHRRYGTTHRIINMVVGLQIFTIVASRGNVYALGEAYAFGVVWSFVFKALSMVMLRFKDRRPREWRVPLNVRVGRWELPVGLTLIFLVLLATALVNLVTKKVATQWGVAFTIVFFVIFWISEHVRRRNSGAVQHLEKFNVRYTPELEPEIVGVRPGCKVVPVRDPKNLQHLDRALQDAETEDADVVVPTVKVERELVATGTNPNFTPDEQAIFTAVVDLAEKHGKTVVPLVLTSNDVYFAIARTAQELGAREVILGRSGKLAPDVQAEAFAIRWGAVEPNPDREVKVRIVSSREDLRFAV
ncbi:MAG: amino acid permease [Deltaproteobacteria bacterium]|nr:MAG: amino acid permease [Deltaproteobacteria bacterium]